MAKETSSAPVAPGPRMPRRVVTLEVPEYSGFTVTIRTNFPQRLADDINSGQSERIEAALREIVIEHNGWCDEAGNPLPPATDPGFWNHPELSTELASVVIALINQATRQLPNSLQSRRRS